MLLWTHFRFGTAKSPHSRAVLAVSVAFWLFYCVSLGFQTEVRLRDVMLAVVTYSAVLFVFLTEALVSGAAAWLTRWRGEQWTKELDYVYLAFGVLGLVLSLGKIENVSDKISAPGILGAGLVATALVLRNYQDSRRTRGLE